MNINKICSNFDTVLTSARNTKLALDTSNSSFNFKKAKKSYVCFMNQMVKCPTRAKVAMNDVIKKDGLTRPNYYYFHKLVFDFDPSMATYIKKYRNIEESQPRTKYLRNLLIENNRITLDKVTPKLTGLKKLLLNLKVMF